MKLRISLCAFLLAVAVFFPTSAAKAVTFYMSSNSDDVNKFTPPGPVSNFAHLPFGTNPEGLAFDSSGNLFVAGGGNVSKITPGGTVSVFANLPFSAGGYGMAIDPSNNLYVADAFIHQISKIDPAGTVSFFADLGSSGPTGLTLDDNGNVYACTAQTITKITPDGGTLSTYATLPFGSNNTYGLAFDADGYLYASDFFATSIYKINPGGGSYSNFGTISGAKGLAFAADGNLYAANPNADLIYKITPDGTTTVFGNNVGNPRYLAFRPITVPEPSSIVLFGLGLAGLLAFFLRRKSRLAAQENRNGGVLSRYNRQMSCGTLSH